MFRPFRAGCDSYKVIIITGVWREGGGGGGGGFLTSAVFFFVRCSSFTSYDAPIIMRAHMYLFIYLLSYLYTCMLTCFLAYSLFLCPCVCVWCGGGGGGGGGGGVCVCVCVCVCVLYMLSRRSAKTTKQPAASYVWERYANRCTGARSL